MKLIYQLILLLSLALSLAACGESDSDSGAATPAGEMTSAGEMTGDPAGESAGETTTPDASICENEFALCGSLAIPEDFAGSTVSLAVVLYDSLEPSGPPSVTVTTIPTPEIQAGQSFPVRFEPVIATGQYYLWVFLYMEGGGEWQPVSGVDYVAHTDEMITFDGSPVDFSELSLTLAE